MSSNLQRFIDVDGHEYEVRASRHLNSNFISILLNGIDEVTFRSEDAGRIAAMIMSAASNRDNPYRSQA